MTSLSLRAHARARAGVTMAKAARAAGSARMPGPARLANYRYRLEGGRFKRT